MMKQFLVAIFLSHCLYSEARTTTSAPASTRAITFSYEGDDSVSLKGCGIGAAYWGDRIVGGTEVSIVQFPWQVSIRTAKRGSHFCGGSLLNTRFVITAGHCVKDQVASGINIAVGSTSLKSLSPNGKTINVKKIYLHENYSPINLNDDIAIIELEESISEAKNLHFPFIRGVCLPKMNEEFDGKSTVSGWGRTSEATYGSTDHLRAVDVLLMTDDACRKDYGKSKIYDSMICAGYNEGGRDACQGDSGGPLVKLIDNRAVLLGVVSWGYGCARPGNPGVYTQVSRYIDWIEGIVKGTPIVTHSTSSSSSSWGWFPWKETSNTTSFPLSFTSTTDLYRNETTIRDNGTVGDSITTQQTFILQD